MALPPETPTWALFIAFLVLEAIVIVNLVRFRSFVYGFFSSWSNAEARETLWKEIAHGVLRAASERSGAIAGAASRKAEAALSGDVTGLAISGLANFLPKKYQAFAPLIAPYIQQFLSAQGNASSQVSQVQPSNSGWHD